MTVAKYPSGKESFLTAFAVPASGTGHASFLIDNCVFIFTLRATVTGLGSVGDKLFKAVDYSDRARL